MLKQLGFGLSAVLLFVASNSAHADFNKALEAFVNRDGAVMLAEVRSSVEKQNDQGLLLFLNALMIDESTSQRITIKERSNKKTEQQRNISTFKTILTKHQQVESMRLLQIAVKKSSADAQLRWLFLSKTTDKPNAKVDWNAEFEKLANRGNYFAAAQLAQAYSYPDQTFSKEKAKNWFIKAAELGDPEYAFGLAMKYLHHATKYWISHECSPEFGSKTVCFDKDVSEGFSWLMKAAQIIDEHPELLRRFAYEMGNIYLTKFDAPDPDPHQAYLWYLLGIKSPQPANTGPDDEAFIAAFNKMHLSGELKKVSPALDEVWKDAKKRDKFIFIKDMPELPELLTSVRRKKLADIPVFSFQSNTPIYYYIDVYSNGTVRLQLNDISREVRRDIYMQVSPQKIEDFLRKLDSFEIDHWRLNNPVDPRENYVCGDSPCATNDYFIRLNRGINRRTIYFGEVRQAPEINPENILQLAKVLALLEEYFPTQELRCCLGTSTSFRHDCLERENFLNELAK